MAQVGFADEPAQSVAAAIADSNRPLPDRNRDADRKPAQVIAFAGLKPGDRIGEFLPPTGYWARIFCNVVGESGKVYSAVLPSEESTDAPADPPASDAAGAACTNVTTQVLKARNFPAPELHGDSEDPGWVYEYFSPRQPVESYAAPEPLDMIWISDTYHALHTQSFGTPNLKFVDTALLSALKSGGALIIEDHAASAGSGARDAQTLHRVDADQVKRELVAAGFEFVGESQLLHRAKDKHSGDAYSLGDSADRFLLKFRKP
jgi:predicted methyltransferase